VSWGIDAETIEAGCGPVVLDVAMARDHGWSEEQIRRAFEEIRRVAIQEGLIAKVAHPEMYETDEFGNSVFVGDRPRKRVI
jgi:hypothetical protein